MRISRTLTTLILIALLTVLCLAAAMTTQQEDVHAKVASAASKKAKTYSKSANKLFKVSGSWYCFSSKKVKTGLQKVGKDYYFFSKSTGKMYVRTGLKKVGTAYYYFSKKSGKAPALRNAAKNISGKVWFFKSNGKRYKYSYLNTGSSAGNTAAGVIIAGASIKADGTGTDSILQKAYKEIVTRGSYRITSDPDLGSDSWIGKTAKDCAVNKGGKCYGFAALTYVTFKALGDRDVRLVTGSLDRPRKDGTRAVGAHAWLLRQADGPDVFLFDSNQDNTNGKGNDFYNNRIIFDETSEQVSFTRDVEGSTHIYYPEKYFG